MTLQTFKLFRKIDQVSALAVPFLPPKESYYKWCQYQATRNNRQVIVSNNIMLHLLKFYFIQKKANILELETDHTKFNSEINKLTPVITKNRDYIIELYSLFLDYNEDEPLEITKLKIQYLNQQKNITITIAINGIINITDTTSIDNELKTLSNQVDAFFLT